MDTAASQCILGWDGHCDTAESIKACEHMKSESSAAVEVASCELSVRNPGFSALLLFDLIR
jgi:hypothetical protein